MNTIGLESELDSINPVFAIGCHSESELKKPFFESRQSLTAYWQEIEKYRAEVFSGLEKADQGFFTCHVNIGINEEQKEIYERHIIHIQNMDNRIPILCQPFSLIRPYPTFICRSFCRYEVYYKD